MHDDQARLEAARLEEVLAQTVAGKRDAVHPRATSVDEPGEQSIHEGFSHPDTSPAGLYEQLLYRAENGATRKCLDARRGVADDVVVDGADPDAPCGVVKSPKQ